MSHRDRVTTSVVLFGLAMAGLTLAGLAGIGVLLYSVIAVPDIAAGPQLCLDALDTFSHELERAFREHPDWPAVDLAEEPKLQAAARAVVSTCSPWILETGGGGAAA